MIRALDLLNEVADRLGYPQIKSLEVIQQIGEHRKLLRLLNRVLRTVSGYNDWPFLRTEGSIVLLDSETGSGSEYVTATNASATITIDGGTFDDTYIGRAFQATGYSEIFRIVDVPAPTQLTLDRAWVSDSITAADEILWTIAMDRYALPSDFDRAVGDWKNFFAPHKIEPVTAEDMWDTRRRRTTMKVADPNSYTIFGLTDTESAQIVVFDPYPETARLLRFPYQRVHPEIDSDQDKILYPHTYMTALIDIMVDAASRDYEDSAKMQRTIQDAVRSHSMQQANPGATDSRPVLRPKNEIRQSMRLAFGATRGRIDWGPYWEDGSIFGF